MNTILDEIKRLVGEGNVRISDHGYDELAADQIYVKDVVVSIVEAVEVYPEYPKGPCVLLLQKDGTGSMVHAVWGIPKGHTSPAVLITAYRPDPMLWEEGFMRRKQ